MILNEISICLLGFKMTYGTRVHLLDKGTEKSNLSNFNNSYESFDSLKCLPCIPNALILHDYNRYKWNV